MNRVQIFISILFILNAIFLLGCTEIDTDKTIDNMPENLSVVYTDEIVINDFEIVEEVVINESVVQENKTLVNESSQVEFESDLDVVDEEIVFVDDFADQKNCVGVVAEYNVDVCLTDSNCFLDEISDMTEADVPLDSPLRIISFNKNSYGNDMLEFTFITKKEGDGSIFLDSSRSCDGNDCFYLNRFKVSVNTNNGADIICSPLVNEFSESVGPSGIARMCYNEVVTRCTQDIEFIDELNETINIVLSYKYST